MDPLGKRVEPDCAELHLGHDGDAQGGGALPSRHLPGDHGLHRGMDGANAGNVFVDAAHVSRQRLELHVGDDRGGRRQRVPPAVRRRRDLRLHRASRRGAPLRPVRHAQHAGECVHDRPVPAPKESSHPQKRRVESESVMYMHPAMNKVAVVARLDEFYGETPCAFLVHKEDMRSTVTATDVIAWCRECMSHYMVSKTVVFRAELPRRQDPEVPRQGNEACREKLAARCSRVSVNHQYLCGLFVNNSTFMS
ncbi:hypothetical protein EJB05_40134, partial [Eragrostis curvula]